MFIHLRTALLCMFVFVFIGSSMSRTGQVADRIMALQEKGVRFKAVSLFERVPNTPENEARWSGAAKKAEVLKPIAGQLRVLMSDGPKYISLSLPTFQGDLLLDLEYTEITTSDFRINTASGATVGSGIGAHYRGMVRGVPGSWAAISVFDGEVMGLLDDGLGELVLGRFEDRRDEFHILYRERDLHRRNSYTCATQDDGEPYHTDQLELQGADRTIRCVRYYWEVNHNVFLDKGDLANTINYVTGLFNQSAILFDNDGIDVTLSELFVWDVPSPYVGPASTDFLDEFGDERTSFNGDMAHLIGYGGGGGVAWLNTLCSSQSRLRQAYSGINSSYSNVPTYSWSVEVVTHEQGHNLGSRHTHACSWNGNGTSIDGCGPAAGYSEGSCPEGPIPSSAVKGTIMSYCHLVSGVGISFNNGFGPQPTAVIVNAVNGASCLGVCGTTCDAPGNLIATGLTVNSANLSWSAVGVTGYDLQWREVGAGTWTTVNGLVGNTYALGGLAQGTAYEFRVRSICDAQTSAYSSIYTFTTAVPCPDTMEPNNTFATAALITLPASVSALIASNSDEDFYRFTLTSTSTIYMSLSNLAGDYDLFLLDGAGTELASSEYGGTTNESINYANAAAGTYHVRVDGYNGAFSATQCYSLYVNAYATGCDAPDGISVSNITETSASISWPSVQGASGFELQWRLQGAPAWTSVPGNVTSPYSLAALEPYTTYDVEVRSVCSGGSQGGTNSAYSSTTFTTVATYCGGSAPIKVGVQVFLDGPYDEVADLMTDSLRSRGLLPLTEPYSTLGYTVVGATATTEARFEITGVLAITDWVLVELRAENAPYTVIESRVGLLQRNGLVTDVHGTQFLEFCAAPGMYRVGVRHRNHLSAMSVPVSFGSGPLPAFVPFSSGSSYGTDPQRVRGSRHLLWAGNALRDGQVLYTGDASDRDVVLFLIGGVIPTNTVTGYLTEDCNLDGTVRYTGTDNDRDIILNTIGGVIPTNAVIEQIP
ncbi:MAG TPA: fibronectin type III domain-containing protein [Flavobacteriales bacterium]|jgi:hypothetical protein|nr:fibronectin type III domain-containing protein [Flavobacteriales bacterium]MBK6551741.1 fibronectin type III domain-containing protein [Flavobacteriales bacterium]MBK7101517.1 fibronectin type III domain-containing protein [Flavobacteriales bacterium]MBK7618756.1 fibronectin type III domain-containing protein [Flavobacteriales bacterium]MBK9627260.1 fibronectin type III domain-containing protein [Flavobacteriales bacterium]